MQKFQATDTTYLAGTGFPDTLQPTDVTSRDNGVTGAGSALGQEGPGTTIPPNYSAGFFSSDDNLKPSPADAVSTLSDTHQTSADTSGYSDNFFSSDGNIKPSPTSASNSISTVSC